MKSSVLLIFVCLIFQGCRPTLSNKVDREFLECGVSSQSIGSRKVFRSQHDLIGDELQVFDAEGAVISDYEITSKNCLILSDSSHATSIVIRNSSAARLDKVDLDFRSCGQDCSVFAQCGYFESGSAKAGAWAYPKIRNASGNLNAILEAETGTHSVDVSEKSCVRIDSSTQGTLRIIDSEGKFLESSLQNFLRVSPRHNATLQIVLREPLSKEEIFCKRNTASYKMVEDKCVLKDMRDFCSEFKNQVNKKFIRMNFETQNCERMWVSLSVAEKISFTAADLKSVKYFSNLPNLKGLNLSGNPDLGSLSEMKGTDGIEELIVSHSNFDLTELGLFPSVRSLAIGKIKEDWVRSPIFPQIKRIELSNDEEFDAEILKKFPNIEELVLNNRAEISGSLEFLESFDSLKKIEIRGGSLSKKFPSIKSLEEIYAESLVYFNGDYPNLKVVEIKRPDNLGILGSSMNLERIIVSESEVDAPYESLSGMVFQKVKLAKLSHVDTFKVLNSFPSVEHLELTLYGLGWAGSLEKFDVAPLHKLINLEYLKLETGDFWGNVLPFEGITFPNLKEADISCGCDLKNMNMPVLARMNLSSSLHYLDLSTAVMPALQELEIYMWTVDDVVIPFLPNLTRLHAKHADDLRFLTGKVPKLTSLTLSSEGGRKIDFIPAGITSLGIFKYQVDFNRIADLPLLKNLSFEPSDIEGFEFDASNRTIHLQSLWLSGGDGLRANMQKMPRFITKQYKGPLSAAVLSKVDTSEIVQLSEMDAGDFLMFESEHDSSFAFPHVKIFMPVGGIESKDFVQKVLGRFPAVDEITAERLSADFFFSVYSLLTSETSQLLSKLSFTLEAVYGYLDDEKWSALDCMNHYQEENAIGLLCRGNGLMNKWDYRPTRWFTWDYE
jgi:hypothetical protein